MAAGMAGRLRFWDYQPGIPFLFLEYFGPGAWLALLPDGRFDGTPEALRYLCYTRRNSFDSFTAEEVLDTFYKPKAVQEVLAEYNVPLPSPASA